MLLVALLMFNRIVMPPGISIVDKYQRQMSNTIPKYNIKNKIKQIIITP